MDYFGDESGHLRSLLNGECEICVIAVVAGDKLAASRCPKRAVRKISDIPEARWNDLNFVQKRRMIECLAEQDPLSFGFAAFNERVLKTMDNYHYIYQGVSFPPDWDLALIGYAYGEILFELGALNARLPTFTFDRVASTDQCEAIEEHVRDFVTDLQVFFQGSRQNAGIQAADCIAGAIREDFTGDTDWLSYFEEERIVEARSASLIQLENDLSRYSTGP